MQTESILEKSYDLLKYFMALVEKFPKHQRFLVGDRIQQLAMRVLGPKQARGPLPATPSLHSAIKHGWGTLADVS